MLLQQQDLGADYYSLEREEILDRIASRKQETGCGSAGDNGPRLSTNGTVQIR